MKHLKKFWQINEELDSTDDLFRQQFVEKYPTREDFDRAFNEFCGSKECTDRFGHYPSGNQIDPMYDGDEQDKMRMMIELEWGKIDPENRSGWRETTKNNWYLTHLRDDLPYKTNKYFRVNENLDNIKGLFIVVMPTLYTGDDEGNATGIDPETTKPVFIRAQTLEEAKQIVKDYYFSREVHVGGRSHDEVWADWSKMISFYKIGDFEYSSEQMRREDVTGYLDEDFYEIMRMEYMRPGLPYGPSPKIR